MQIITRTAAEALIALLLLVPIFELLNRRRFHNDQRTGAYLVFAAYLCAIYVVVGLPDIGYFRFRPNINLKPFQYMFSDLRSTVPNVFLFGATSIGRDLAPRLSARLRTGLTADCTKLENDEEGNLFMTRPAFGGNLMATIICPNSRPQMSTVRPGVMQKLQPDTGRNGQVIPVQVRWQEEKFAVELVEEVKENQNVEKIEDAKILVSCGRGLKDTAPAFDLAQKLGGTVSSSRALVDTGVMEHARQVGQTGKTVRPQAYLAFGISGAIQHLAGMEESEFIVAINTDKSAPIFKVANLGIVADAAATMKELNKILE